MVATEDSKVPWEPETQRPDVAVLVALKEETLALREAVGQQTFYARRNVAFPGHDYLLLADNERGRPYRVVLYLMDDMGPPAAASATSRLLSMNPRLVANIGIACSLHAGDLPLCSVLVASQVDGYDERSKAGDDGKGGWEWTFGGKVYSPTEEWGRIAGDLAVSHPELFEQWQAQCVGDFDALVNRARDGKKIEALRRKGYLPEHPVIQRGHVATGVSVAAAAAFKKKVLRRDRNFKALEMETAGMLRVAQERIPVVETLVLKGVSDLGDANKKQVDGIGPGAIRKAAMRNAVRVLWTLMRAGLLPQVEEESPTRKREAAATSGAREPRPRDAPATGRVEGSNVRQVAIVSSQGRSPPQDPSTAPLDDESLVEALAELVHEPGMATVLLNAIGFPKARRPRFGTPLVFWTEIVEALHGGVIEGAGVRVLVNAAANRYPGNETFKRAVMPSAAARKDATRPADGWVPKRDDDPLAPPHRDGFEAKIPTSPSSTGDEEPVEALAQWRRDVEEEVARFIESTAGLRACLGRVSAWQAAAVTGSAALADALMADASPVELVDGLYEAMTWLDAGPDGAQVAEGLRKVLLLVLPVVGGPCVRFERESAHVWTMNVGFDWMVEFRIAYHDRRRIDGPEWRAKDVLPPPTTLVPSHHGEIPEFGMDGVRRVEDAARAIVDRSNPIERDDRLHTMATHILAKRDLRQGAGIPRRDVIGDAANFVRRAGERKGRLPPKTYYTILDEEAEGDGLSVIAELIDTKLGVRVIVPRMQPEDRTTTSRFRGGLSDFFMRYLEISGAASP